jgi:tRNA-splicing ligase RtcB (3'-phosphate/5'-hydroxy nucleic acid ligase)
MTESTYNVLKPDRGVPLEASARQQLLNVGQLPLILPVGDGHAGRALRYRRDRGQRDSDARGAIIPASIGVDIGCAMMALQTSLPAL